MIRRIFYGWYDPRRMVLLVSREPPDAPVRPAREFLTREEAAAYATKRRGRLMWIPELPAEFKIAS